jgi:hypothetical protein
MYFQYTSAQSKHTHAKREEQKNSKDGLDQSKTEIQLSKH